MRHRRRSARSNPASAGGILLTLVGFGVMAFSAFELATGGKGAAAPRARPAPPKVKPPAPPVAHLPASTTTTTTTTSTPAAAPPNKPPAAPSAPSAPSPQQVQQAVQAGQAIVSGAESLFGGSSTPAPTFGDGSSPDAPVDLG